MPRALHRINLVIHLFPVFVVEFQAYRTPDETVLYPFEGIVATMYSAENEAANATSRRPLLGKGQIETAAPR
jgi:hypothetical protein